MDFPDVVYFDTNIVRSLTLGNTNPKFLELRELAQQIKMPDGIKLALPHVVSLEWLHKHSEAYDNKLLQTKSNLTEIEELTGIPQPKLITAKDDFGQLVETYVKKLKQLGIIVTPTPKNISIDELLIMAAFKVRPFEEKGEKGFRDAIILYTILEDMKKKKYKNAIFMSNDNIFQHEDVKEKIKKYAMNITILHSFDEAINYIRNILDEKRKRLIDLQNKKLFDFVSLKSNEILNFVKDNTEISQDFIEKESFFDTKYELIGQIEEVRSFVPKEIKSAFVVPYLNDEITKKTDDKDPIIISVETDVTVTFLPFLYFNKPRVKTDDLTNFKQKLQSANVQYYGEPVDKELKRTVSVHAILKKDKEGNYADIELTRVFAL